MKKKCIAEEFDLVGCGVPKNQKWRFCTQTSTTSTTSSAAAPHPFLWSKEAQKAGLAGNRTLDHSQADPHEEELVLREYYTTKPQAR
jgi:hypothetical protein